ncbi:MAG: hypothetical protein QXM58_00605, partial [Candidatus Micrarchaeaceae archaeon]
HNKVSVGEPADRSPHNAIAGRIRFQDYLSVFRRHAKRHFAKSQTPLNKFQFLGIFKYQQKYNISSMVSNMVEKTIETEEKGLKSLARHDVMKADKVGKINTEIHNVRVEKIYTEIIEKLENDLKRDKRAERVFIGTTVGLGLGSVITVVLGNGILPGLFAVSAVISAFLAGGHRYLAANDKQALEEIKGEQTKGS